MNKIKMSDKRFAFFAIALFFVFAFLLSFVNNPNPASSVSVTGNAITGYVPVTETNCEKVGTICGPEQFCNGGSWSYSKNTDNIKTFCCLTPGECSATGSGQKAKDSFFKSASDSSSGLPEDAEEDSQDTNFISNLFTQWTGGNLDRNIAKYLFLLILTGLIWGALSAAKFPKHTALQALLAIPVAFLATAYITPEEVFTILQSYTALGITLSFIVPFIIMLLISAMLISDEKTSNITPVKIILECFLWLFFIVILGYKMISGIVSKQLDFGLNLTILIMLAVLIISTFILLVNKRFVAWAWKINLRIRRARATAEREEAKEAARTAKELEEIRKKKTKKSANTGI
jgi:hypothetical protein